jgi:hypothetical protein
LPARQMLLGNAFLLGKENFIVEVCL